jgi:hypothetical protein
MSANKLKLNSDKTELLIIGSQFRPKNQLLPLVIGNDYVISSKCARNIGVTGLMIL